jgi:predicted small lipoprotein YifL
MISALRTILVSGITLWLLVACGQKGPLYLPTGEAATGRATLTETLRPAQSPAAPASAPPTGTASPVRTP